MITRRCTQRQFLLRPDPEVNNTILYCLAEAARRFDVDIVLPSVLSNHHHLIVYDRHGRIIEFIEHFHKFVAKSVNAFRGRWENLWSVETPSRVVLENTEDVVDKLVYAATNPVKDGLVEHVADWPGINGLSALLEGRELTIERPRHFFRKNGPMPETVTLRFSIPPELGDADQILGQVRERVAKVEADLAAARKAKGKRVLGRRAILRQDWRARPASHEPRRRLKPVVAARNKWARIEALLRNREFVRLYREARTLWLAGLSVIFPPGTYWLRRFAGVTVAPPKYA
jgi:REP element-mobilizing transposase RayT